MQILQVASRKSQVAAALIAAVGLVHPARAEPPLGTPDHPQFYMMELPPGWSGCANDPSASAKWVMRAEFVPMLDLNKESFSDTSGAGVYAWLKARYFARFLPNVPANLQSHFNSHIALAKFHAGDSLGIDALNFWAVEDPTEDGPSFQPHVALQGALPSTRAHHPWFWGKVADDDPQTTYDAQAWMIAFMDAWKTDVHNDPSGALPPPTRMFFDTEQQPFGGVGSDDQSMLFEAIAADDRAGIGAVPADPTGLRRNLPHSGQATSASNKPFSTWLAEADADYGAVPIFSLQDYNPACAFFPWNNVVGSAWDAMPGLPEHVRTDNVEFGARENIAVERWYESLWTASFDDAMNRGIYSVVQGIQPGGVTCKTGLYNFYNVETGPSFAPLLSARQYATDLAAAVAPYQANGPAFSTVTRPFVFGWSFDYPVHWKALRQSCSPPHPLSPGNPTNVFQLGKQNVRNQDTEYHASGRKDVATRVVSSADFDVPVLYGVVNRCGDIAGPYFRPNHRKPHLYLPPWKTTAIPSSSIFDRYEQVIAGNNPLDNACPKDDHFLGALATCKAPQETIEQAAVRVARHNVESIINSGERRGSAARLVPWIPMVGTKVWGPQEGSFTDVASEGYLRDLLMMLRSKGVSEFQLFGEKSSLCTNAGSFPTPANWAATTRVYDEVYNLGVDNFAILNGFHTSWGDDFNAISRTNLESDETDSKLVPNVLDLDSETVPGAGKEIAGLVVSFTGERLAPAEGLGTIRVVMEADVERTCASPINPECPNRCGAFAGDDMKDVRGIIYAFDWVTGAYRQLKSPEFTDGTFALYAPLESCRPFDATFAGTFRSVRRTWDFNNRQLRRYIKKETSGTLPSVYRLDLKFVMLGEHPFKLKIDLLQAAYVNSTSLGNTEFCPGEGPQFPDPTNPDVDPDSEGAGGSQAMAPSQGADMTFDFEQDASDIGIFTDAFGDGAASADLNNDGAVDSTDVVQFFDALSNAGGQ